MAYGTYSVIDTLQSNFQTIGQFGEQEAYEQIARLVAAHNEIMNNLESDLVETTTEKDAVYGTPDLMEMSKTDEFGRPDSQKILPGLVVGFPLESFQGTIGWTRKAFENMTVAEMTGQFLGMRVADMQRVILEIKRAIFNPTNYDFDDYLVAKRQAIPIHVRALENADGLGMPVGPNGEIFDSTTHTHYLATASFVIADLIAALETVLEHYNRGNPRIYINRAQEATIRTFTPNFVPYQNVNVVGSITANQIPSRELNTVSLYNRPIGQFNGAEVWVKPWMPANYVFTFLTDQRKPLARRIRKAGSGDLGLVADDEKYPLRARTYEREFGIGIQERVNGSVLYTGSGTYTAPTLAF